ncbi:MAG TPA: tetratricopeptide repeat protein, partial [Candidatus Polarisedimenticolia bacterium]|nr:tetratricopeptide repeat protein [Candidatus Polarisedimenticolia bacterium]
SLEAHDNEMALRLLDKGIAANPDDWLLPFEAGFLCYDTMGDHARAARYFEKAMQVPAAPGVIRRLHAEMFNKMGNKRASLTYWREVFDGAESKDVRDIAWRHVHDLTIGVDLETLQGAIETFRQRTGAYPINLESLVKAGLITAIPVDPDGAVYGYDRRTGRPFSRSRFRLVQRAGP